MRRLAAAESLRIATTTTMGRGGPEIPLEASEVAAWAKLTVANPKGEPTAERLLAWYEGALGFKGPSHRNSGFRVCRKVLEPTGEIKYVCIRWICAILACLCCGQY